MRYPNGLRNSGVGALQVSPLSVAGACPIRMWMKVPCVLWDSGTNTGAGYAGVPCDADALTIAHTQMPAKKGTLCLPV